MLGFAVDAGQDAVGREAAQQPEAGNPCTGAEFGDLLGAEQGGEELEGRTGCRTNGDGADLGPTLPCGGQEGIFGDIRLSEREAFCAGDDRFLFLGFRTALTGLRLSIV